MNLSDELRKLQELHDSGALTTEEFTQAKQIALVNHTSERETSNQETSNQAEVQRRLMEVELQNQLLQLDQDWQTGREIYMIRGNNGRYFPTIEGSFGKGIFIAACGVAFAIAVALAGAGARGIWLFVIFVGLAIGKGAYEYYKAQEYDRAYRNYQYNRDQLIKRYRKRQNHSS